MYFVYVLLSLRDKQFYVGMTKNVEVRLKSHNEGKVISTRDRIPLELLGYEAYWFKVEAGARERYLKSNDGKKELRIGFRVALHSPQHSRGTQGKDLKV